VEIDKEMLRGQIDLVILAMLGRRDLYGYDLAKRVTATTEGAFSLKEATLYLALKRLEQAGLVESYWGDGDIGARRKYYRLRPAGAKRRDALTAQWDALKGVVDTILEGA
jgi:DNA-binding PadR family transcriptional regulator